MSGQDAITPGTGTGLGCGARVRCWHGPHRPLQAAMTPGGARLRTWSSSDFRKRCSSGAHAFSRSCACRSRSRRPACAAATGLTAARRMGHRAKKEARAHAQSAHRCTCTVPAKMRRRLGSASGRIFHQCKALCTGGGRCLGSSKGTTQARHPLEDSMYGNFKCTKVRHTMGHQAASALPERRLYI